jgi:hypothetical protein
MVKITDKLYDTYKTGSQASMEIVSELTALMNEKELLGMQVCVAHRHYSYWSVSLGTRSLPVKL